MKISIVTAVWNRAATIGEAIESVQRQSHADIEHIIQDGGSTDGTLEVVERLADARTRVLSERDSGIYDAINRGIARATGDVVGLLHSDDYLADDDVIAEIARAFQTTPGADAVYGDLDYVAAEDTSRVVRHWKSGSFTPDKLRRGWMPPHPTFYARRTVFDRYGIYDTSFRIAADYDAMLRYLSQPGFTLAYVPQVLVKMRTGGASNASLKHILRKSREDLHALHNNRIGGVPTLVLKNLGKVGQFFARGSQT